MTLTPLLQREIDTLARHEIAKKLLVQRRVRRRYRAEMIKVAESGSFLQMQNLLDRARLNATSTWALAQFAKTAYPRQHPAPGRLDWCLINQHGPVCNSHAEPGSSYCHEHRAYEDIITERKHWS